MKWAVLLGSPDISGGSYVIFEHVIRAKRRGVEVYMVTEQPINEQSLDWHPEAKELNWITFTECQNLNFDIAIATWWRTVYELYRIKAHSYAYFVQSIESRFYPEQEQALRMFVEATYMLPLQFITEATWIKEYLKKEHGKDAHLVLNGIRKDIYCREGEEHAPRVPARLRVLVEGPLGVSFKNVEKTIALCKQSTADEIWLLTSSPVKVYSGIDRVFSRIPIHETPKVYRSCDVIVKLSYVEGMFGPPLEMFHCGGTSITYNVTGHDEYIRSEYNGIVINRDDEEQVICAINSLKENKERLNCLKEGALRTANEWPDWSHSSLNFEKVLTQIIQQNDSYTQELLEKRLKFFFDFYILAERHKNMRAIKICNSAKRWLDYHFPRLYKCAKNIKWKIKSMGRI
jgi:glycosyltransferase involved in cell wall biosynthesis